MSHGKAFFLLLALPSVASAQDLGARAQGRGGVGLADSMDAGAVSKNIAASSLDPHYNVLTGIALGPDSHFLLKGQALDTRTSAVSLGAGYYHLTDNVSPSGGSVPGWLDPNEDFDNPGQHQGAFLGLAVPFLDRKISISGNASYDWETSAYAGKDAAFNFGFGAAFRPVKSLTLAIGARDLLATGYSSHLRTADLGVRFQPGEFLGVEADAIAPLEGDFTMGRFGWHAGADIGVSKWLMVRGGAAFQDEVTSASAGIGLVSEHAMLDYGVRIETANPARNWHAVDLTVLF